MATKPAAMFCMFLVIVQTKEDMVFTQRVNQPENYLLDMLRRKLIFNNVDYEESSTKFSTSSTPSTPFTPSTPSTPSIPSSPPICIMPTNNQQNRDVYNPYNNPYKSNQPSRDSKYLRQGKSQTPLNPYNPYHHPHYKPLRNPGYAPFHRAPYIVYANPDPPLNQPPGSPIYLSADVPINPVRPTTYKTFPQISEFEPDMLHNSPRKFQTSLGLQNPSPPFREYPLHLQSEFPRQIPQEANHSVNHLSALQNSHHTQNFSSTYRPLNPIPRNLPNLSHHYPNLYLPQKLSQRVSHRPPYQGNQLLNRSYPLQQQKKPEFRAYRFIPTSRVTSTTTMKIFPTNSLKPTKKGDEEVNRLQPNTLIPEKDYKRFEVLILNSTQSESESNEAWTAGEPEKTFKGFKLAPGEIPIEIPPESIKMENTKQTKNKGNEDLDELLNQVIKRAAKMRSTPAPLSFQEYQNQSFVARRSGSYLKWQLSHVIPTKL